MAKLSEYQKVVLKDYLNELRKLKSIPVDSSVAFRCYQLGRLDMAERVFDRAFINQLCIANRLFILNMSIRFGHDVVLP